MLRHTCLGNNNGCTRNYAGGARAARANVKQDSQVSHSQVLKYGKFDLVSGQVPMTSECIQVPIQVPMFLGGTPSHLIAPNFGIARPRGASATGNSDVLKVTDVEVSQIRVGRKRVGSTKPSMRTSWS